MKFRFYWVAGLSKMSIKSRLSTKSRSFIYCWLQRAQNKTEIIIKSRFHCILSRLIIFPILRTFRCLLRHLDICHQRPDKGYLTSSKWCSSHNSCSSIPLSGQGSISTLHLLGIQVRMKVVIKIWVRIGMQC